MGRVWTDEEKEYLESKWGIVSIPTIAKKLNRTEGAISLKARRMNLGRFTDNGDYITFAQLVTAFGQINSRGTRINSWIEKRGLPCRYKKVHNSRVRVVKLQDFWEWAEKNKNFIDFSKLEPNTLYGEPEWVKAKRELDNERNRLYKSTVWTKQEEEKLKILLKQHIYTYQQLSDMLCRTTSAICKKINQLGLKERPVRAEHETGWSENKKNEVKELVLQGMSYEIISKRVNRTVGSIRGMLNREYGTERLENIYKILKGIEIYK